MPLMQRPFTHQLSHISRGQRVRLVRVLCTLSYRPRLQAFRHWLFEPRLEVSLAAVATQTQARWAHTRSSEGPAAVQGSPTSSSSSHVRSNAPASPSATTLGVLQRFVQQRDDASCAAYYEQHFNPATQHFIDDFCHGFAADARDTLLLLMRVYTNMGRIDKVREVLCIGLRDLSVTAVDGKETSGGVEVSNVSPLRYAALGNYGRIDKSTERTEVLTSTTTGAGGVASLKLCGDALIEPIPSAAASSSAGSATASQLDNPRHERQQRTPFTFHRYSLLNTSVFNAYLEALTRRNKFDTNEVIFLLDQMKAASVERDALTYHYLIELHVRAGYDPSGLWEEMKTREPPLAPLPATVQTLLLRVVPSSTDPSFVVEITKAALRFGTAVMDKRMLSEMVVQWLTGATQTPTSNSAARDSSPTNSNSNSGSHSSSTPAQAARLHLSSGGLNGTGTTCYPPEYILWLLLELELRCVLEKASFTQYIQRQHLTELLLRCAKCTDAGTAEQVLALMDRHALPKTADVLALVVWCWSQALEVEKTLDLIEWMALKGYLDQVDCFRKAYIDSLRYTMEHHYLMTFAEALSTPALLERALKHLNGRKQRGEMVTAHTLDILVLSCARAGEERRALQLVSTYESRWGVSPRTNTFNSLLVGCSRHRSTMLHRVIYRAMLHSGVVANVFTFRVLIRQAVASGNIDEAIYYLEEVTRHPGLRVEVEMILPILERAARVGDVETANRVSQYSLKCDIGVDGSVLRNVIQQLTEAGQNVDVLKGHLPLHEALRSRSKTGRQRARNEVLL